MTHELKQMMALLADVNELHRKVKMLDQIVDQRNTEIVRMKRQLAAANELLDGQFAEDLHRQTGISIERCRELLEIIRA